MPKNALPPRLRPIFRTARKQGWTDDRTRKGHPRLSPPPGLRHVVDEKGSPVHGQVTMEGTGPLVAPVTFALTPSDIAGDRNSLAELRRAGVAV